jgi:hypothetical protein
MPLITVPVTVKFLSDAVMFLVLEGRLQYQSIKERYNITARATSQYHCARRVA